MYLLSADDLGIFFRAFSDTRLRSNTGIIMPLGTDEPFVVEKLWFLEIIRGFNFHPVNDNYGLYSVRRGGLGLCRRPNAIPEL